MMERVEIQQEVQALVVDVVVDSVEILKDFEIHFPLEVRFPSEEEE